MNNEMEKALIPVKCAFGVLAGLAVLLAVLFETEILEPGALIESGYSETLFLLQSGSVLLTLLLVVAALRLLRRKRVAQRIRCGAPAWAAHYRMWCLIRLGMLGIPLLAQLLLYYALLDQAHALAAAILVLVLCFFCWPDRKRMEYETGMTDTENR